MARLFVAVWPPEHVTEVLAALPRKDQRGVRFVAPENWHVTLRFLGDARVDDVAGVLGDVAFPAATARVGPGVELLDERIVAVPVAGVDELAAIVVARTRHLGTEPPRRRFAGHLTVARAKRRAPLPRALGMTVQAEFAVDAVALVESRLRPDGPRYETVGSWPVG